MNNLLRGLLHPDPQLRLSSSRALLMPVFDKFRGSQLPLLSASKQTSFENDTDIFDDASMELRSFQSLEKRSICKKKPKMSNLRGESPEVFSIRLEESAMSGDMKKPPNLLKLSLQRQTSNSPEKNKQPPKDALAPIPRQDSFESGSKYSADDRMSPLSSPKQQSKIVKGQSTFGHSQNPQQISLFASKSLSTQQKD